MYFRVILSAAGLAVAFALGPGQAEVLDVDSTFGHDWRSAYYEWRRGRRWRGFQRRL